MNKDEWKNDPEFGYYDYQLLSRVNRNLRMARQGDRVNELKDHLQGVVKPNFGGVENTRLYSQTYHGTKKPIEEYVQEGNHHLFNWTTTPSRSLSSIMLTSSTI